MIYERHFVRSCFVNPSNRVPITLIISAYFFGIALLSRDNNINIIVWDFLTY